MDIGLIIDDIAGTAKDEDDHDAKLRIVLQQAREKGVKFNQEKCIFDAENIPYFGHLLTTKGIKAYPKKTKGNYQTCQHQNHMNSYRCYLPSTPI